MTRAHASALSGCAARLRLIREAEGQPASRRRLLPETGIAEEPMSIAFFLCDQAWMNQRGWWNSYTKKWNGNPPRWYIQDGCKPVKLFEVPRGMKPEAYVSRVIDLLEDDQIATLHIACHGDYGTLRLGNGLTIDSVGAFEELRPHFDQPRGMIKIYACGVASETSVEGNCTLQDRSNCDVPGTFTGRLDGRGYGLLKAMANLTGASVQAAVNATRNFAPYFFNFNGELTVWFYPDVFPANRNQKTQNQADFIKLDYNEKGRVQ